MTFNERTVERYPLTRSVVEPYLQAQLSQGLALAGFLRRRLSGRTTYWTVAPSGTPSLRLHDFSSALGLSPEPVRVDGGGVRIQRVTRLAEPIADDLHSRLQHSGGLCIVEDHVRRSADLSPLVRLPCWIEHGEEVYYVMNASASTAAVEEGLSAGTSYMAIAIHAIDPFFQPSCGDPVAASVLESLADSATLIVVGAYDRESYVVAELL